MQWLKTSLREIFGLFVDDGSFALAIIIWLGLAWLILPRLTVSPAWNGAILFAGLALILLESVWRRAKQ